MPTAIWVDDGRSLLWATLLDSSILHSVIQVGIWTHANGPADNQSNEAVDHGRERYTSAAGSTSSFKGRCASSTAMATPKLAAGVLLFRRAYTFKTCSPLGLLDSSANSAATHASQAMAIASSLAH